MAIGAKGKQRTKQYGEGFRQNVEAVRSNYETYKRSNEPSTKQTQASLDRGSSSAERRVARANREADYESSRERNRAEQLKDVNSHKWKGSSGGR